MNLRPLKVFTSTGFNSNHSPFLPTINKALIARASPASDRVYG